MMSQMMSLAGARRPEATQGTVKVPSSACSDADLGAGRSALFRGAARASVVLVERADPEPL
jgi:hypothetical protein